MSRQNHVLITGASGFTGLHACKHFADSGFDVTAVARKSFPACKRVRIETCDLRNKDEVNSLVKKVKPQYVLHLAGLNHVGESWIDPLSFFESNSVSTAYLIDALRQEQSSQKIVIVGSALQFDPHRMSSLLHPYSLSKTLQVLIAQAWSVLFEMPVVIAKPSNLIGPGVSNGVCSIFAQKIANMEKNESEKLLEINNLNAQRDFIDVRDAVSAYETLFLMGDSGETYDISSGKSYSLGDIALGFKSFASVDFEIVSKVHDLIEPKVNIIPIKMMELGWKPIIPIESSLKEILDFYRGSMRI